MHVEGANKRILVRRVCCDPNSQEDFLIRKNLFHCFHKPQLLLTAKASWYSKTSMSETVNPTRSKSLGVAYAGLVEGRRKRRRKKDEQGKEVKLCSQVPLWFIDCTT